MASESLQVEETIDLTAKTRELLKARPEWMSYPRIERDTGLKASWLNKFASGKHETTLSKLTKLYTYLKPYVKLA